MKALCSEGVANHNNRVMRCASRGARRSVRRSLQATQAEIEDEQERLPYAGKSLKPGFRPQGETWYLENSREQIRDEIIRQGLIPNNAVLEKPGLATTSSRPRYALRTDFVALFDPTLSDEAFTLAAENWRESHLSATALARTVLMRRGAVTTGEGVLVTFPNFRTVKRDEWPLGQVRLSQRLSLKSLPRDSL